MNVVFLENKMLRIVEIYWENSDKIVSQFEKDGEKWTELMQWIQIRVQIS